MMEEKKPGDADKRTDQPVREYEAPRITRRVPIVRNTLGQPPGPGSGASGSQSFFPE
jgi:hypothetical protein